MNENLYAEYPAAYDALYAEKDYDAEVEFVLSQFEESVESESDASESVASASVKTDADAKRALVVGCGTGEHSKRLRAAGFEVVGVDKYPAMVERARTKSDAEFRVGALPDLPVEGEFDLVWLPFTVVQHLPEENLADSFRALGDQLADGGLLVFDQISSEDFDGDTPYLKTYSSDEGTYARLTQVHPVSESESQYEALVFTPDGDFFVDTHRLFNYDERFLTGVCEALGLSVERHGWYDEEAEPGEEGHIVFVARDD